MTKTMPIFMIHHVVPRSELPYDAHLYLTAETLRRQIAEIRASGFELVTVSEVWRRIRDPGETAPCAALTFDDTYHDFVEYALPVLVKREAPATVYPILRNIAPGDTPPRVPPGLTGLSHRELREIDEAGIEIGSHTVTHRELTTLTDEEVHDELQGSKDGLEQVLGHEVPTLCYPRGRFSRRIVEAAEAAGYACALSTLRGNRQSPAGRWALRRIRAGEERVGWKLRYTLWRAYDWLNRSRRAREIERFESDDAARAS